MAKRGKRGFTLIELLIVVAILGVLAAVIIPNVGRFLGRGKTEAQKTELNNVRTAVIAMMADNNLGTIPNPVTVATTDMGAFPDATSVAGSANKLKDRAGANYSALDKNGYLLWQHDNTADGLQTGLVNYVSIATTQCKYVTDNMGTITQSACP